MSGLTAYSLYTVFALGGIAVYFSLPGTKSAGRFVGLGLGVLAVVALLMVLTFQLIVPDATTGFFYLFSFIALVAGGRVITHAKPVYSALYFVLVVVAVAALLVLLQAEFLAVALVIIYAGAILVTYLFVIMLAQQAGSPTYDCHAREPFAAVLAGFVLMAAIAGRAVEFSSRAVDDTSAGALVYQKNQEEGTAHLNDGVSPIPEGNTAAVGAALMTHYVAALQIAGVLLLVSMVGAIALSRKKVASETVIYERPPRDVGRKVAPF